MSPFFSKRKTVVLSKLKYVLFIFLISFLMGGVRADGIEIVKFDNPQQEQRYLKLVRELRCLVCQNQPLSDSGAELAQDMRTLIQQMIKEEKTNTEIVDFMVARYGNFVRYTPPFTWYTSVLWLAPLFIFLWMLGWIPKLIKKQKKLALSDEERERARKIMEE